MYGISWLYESEVRIYDSSILWCDCCPTTVSTTAGVNLDATVGCPHGHNNSERCCCSARSHFFGGLGVRCLGKRISGRAVLSPTFLFGELWQQHQHAGVAFPVVVSHIVLHERQGMIMNIKPIEDTKTTQAITAAIATSTANTSNTTAVLVLLATTIQTNKKAARTAVHYVYLVYPNSNPSTTRARGFDYAQITASRTQQALSRYRSTVLVTSAKAAE